MSRIGNLATRIASALILAPLALTAAWFGGIYFTAFFVVAATAVLFEWWSMVTTAPNRLIWFAAGVAYAGILLLAPVLLREDPGFGLTAMLFIFAVVWGTDIAAYFAGRAIGGPKLAPSISPNKTWSGAIGGLTAALVAALVVARYLPGSSIGWLLAVGCLLSIVSQIGDLAESAMKRRFGVKDTGRLIPGHGGVMDRLDGFWAAVFVALVVGVARGGFAAPARGLLVW